ncbi:MAG: homocysteine S-methyltransferase family protein [Gammaproteobacteria bacterium]|nr:homocysteine S-methyltransferase family protein [Gammaproteobacteria bacterium]
MPPHRDRSAAHRAPENRPILLLDGGTGRELLRRGAPFRQPEWSALALMEGPAFVSEVHRSYIRAGAQVITTNSYALVPFHIGPDRFARDGSRLAALAGSLAREAADEAPGPVRVAGSLPPVCGSYRPDLFDVDEARPVLARLVAALEPYVDLWLSETVSSGAEMELMQERVSHSRHPWWVSYTLADEPTSSAEPQLRSGESVTMAVAHAAQRGAQAVLFNCCQPEVIARAMPAARRTLDATATADVRLGGYANAFAPQGQTAAANAGLSALRADLDPPQYLRWVWQWLRDGADTVGGCCGVGPEHIAMIQEALGRAKVTGSGAAEGL